MVVPEASRNNPSGFKTAEALDFREGTMVYSILLNLIVN